MNDSHADEKIELIIVPAPDVDRAKAFYTEKLGFHADFDQQVREDLRFVQLTPPVRPASFRLVLARCQSLSC